MSTALIICERSGTVRDAFRRRGWDAYSLDLKPDDFQSPYHIQADLDELADPASGFFGTHADPTFDLIIAHPPCQYLSVIGHNTTPEHKKQERAEKTKEAINFVKKIMGLPCRYMAIENPRSLISSHIRPSDQMIQPYEFGHHAKKGTCLWLKNLPKLSPTNIVEPKYACKCMNDASRAMHRSYRFDAHLGQFGCPWCDGTSGPAKLVYGNQTTSGHCKKQPETTETAKTFPNIAEAMADQWGHL
jgi:hypothetical protein